MNDYSYGELTDMYYCYGSADGQSKEAAKMYADKYPDRDHPDHTIFLKIDSQLRQDGCFTEEDNAKNMADAEVKRKGRPKKKEVEVVETKKSSTVSNGDDGVSPAKRGRGRPPKGATAMPKKVSATGRGRGRPPKSKSPLKALKKKKESEDEGEDEEDEEDDDEKKESSGDDQEEE